MISNGNKLIDKEAFKAGVQRIYSCGRGMALADLGGE